jgi:hypothetical protein
MPGCTYGEKVAVKIENIGTNTALQSMALKPPNMRKRAQASTSNEVHGKRLFPYRELPKRPLRKTGQGGS